MLQYGIKKPKLKTIVTSTEIVLDDGYEGNLDDRISELHDFVIDCINNDLVPGLTNGVQNLYYVIPPYHPLYELETYGVHSAYANTNPMTNPTTQGLVFGATGAYENWAAVVAVTAHEIAEMLSNPFGDAEGGDYRAWEADAPPNDWTNQQPPDGFEIGDWCEAAAAEGLKGFLSDTVAVYPTWSNLDNGCKAFVAPPTWLTCPTGFTYQTSTQNCFKPGTGGGGGGGGGTTPTVTLIGEIPSTQNSGAVMDESDNDAVALMITDSQYRPRSKTKREDNIPGKV